MLLLNVYYAAINLSCYYAAVMLLFKVYYANIINTSYILEVIGAPSSYSLTSPSHTPLFAFLLPRFTFGSKGSVRGDTQQTVRVA